MTNAVSVASSQPPKAPNGLTLPLSKSLASQDLAKHRALVALELEVLAKKLDRFGWERDRNTPAHDRLVIDWMEALQDFPLEEIRAACRETVKARPNTMPNEGHIVAKIMEARAEFFRNAPKVEEEPAGPPRELPPLERRKEIVAETSRILAGLAQKIGAARD